MISTDWRFCPSTSYSRHSSRPSMATGRPLERKREQFSPWAPHTVTSKKLGLSSHSPVALFLRRVLQAIRSLQTDMPPLVERSSGSRVRFPVITTRLMLVAAMLGAPFQESLSSSCPSLGPARSATAALPGKWAERLQSGGQGVTRRHDLVPFRAPGRA